MQINKRPLGSSGIEITTVGFGSWAIGGGGWSFGWGPQDDKASIDSMRRAIELGVNWIDTAAVYGLGHSEEVVGRFVRSLPVSERPHVFTKCGLIWDERNRMQESKRVLKPESIRAECEASLRRLGIQRIDLYQFHWPDDGHAHRGFMGRDAASDRGRQSEIRRRFQFRRQLTGALQRDSPRGFIATAVLFDSPRGCGA